MLQRNVVDSGSDSDNNLSATAELWKIEFDRYIKTVEAVSQDADIVDLWGVCDRDCNF